MLRESALPIDFHGFVEGTDVTEGVVDVVVTDGFTGNVALKIAEGTAAMFTSALREAFRGGGLDFQVDDGLGWLSRSHVVNAQNRVPRHIANKGFQPVEDAGVEGLAQDQPDTDDDCSQVPEDVAELIAAEGSQ